MIKKWIQQEDIISVNIFAHNIRVCKYIIQMLTDINVEIDSNTIIVENINTPLTSIKRISGPNKETASLN